MIFFVVLRKLFIIIEKDNFVSTPLVTIGIPFYNNQDTLLDSIKSIFAQTLQDWELLLVDDGSTDNSLQIAQSIDDPRVRVFSDGANKRLPARLNQIIEMAQGEYIARMDADDMCGTTRIEKQVELMKSQPDTDVTGTGICYLGRNDTPVGHWHAQPTHDKICRHKPYKAGLCHGSILAKKSWYEKNRYDESVVMGQDFNLFFRTYKHSTFANVLEPLYYYRLDQSFTLKQQWTAREASARFLFNHYNQAGDRWRAFANWVTQYGKFAVTALMFAAGLRKGLMARRFAQLSVEEMKFHQKQISKIKNTQLPIISRV